MPPIPMPARTTASMTANAVDDDATYKRRKRNQTTSSASRMQPVPKLMNRRRSGARYPAFQRSGKLDCRSVDEDEYFAGDAATLATSIAMPAATQFSKPA